MRFNQCLIAGFFLLLNLGSVSAKTVENIPLRKPVEPSAELPNTDRRRPDKIHPEVTRWRGAVSTAPTRTEIESAANTAEARGRIVLLTPAGASVPTILKELASLPVTFRSVIGTVSYDITVLKMTLEPEGSRLTVGCRFVVPGGDVLYFGADDIAVSAASGFGGDLPILESMLSDAGAGEIDDPQNRLGGATRFAEITWPSFKGKATFGLGKESRMTFSCGLFKKFTLNGFMKIRDLTERETLAGATLNDQKPLILFWGTQEITDWEDMYFEATVSRGFHAASCRDLGFHFSDPAGIVLDLSRYRSPANLPDCGLQNKEEWQGIGFEAFQLRLPTLFKLRTPKALTGRGTNLFLGPDGLIGNMTAEKVFSLEEGYTDEVNRFDQSLEVVSAVFGCGAVETMVTMSGRIRLGNCTAGDDKKKELDYRIIFNEHGQNYRVMVKESTADRFQNTGLTLSTGSVLTLTVNEGGFLFKTALAKKPLLTTPAYNNSICLNYPTTISAQNCDALSRKWSTDEQEVSQITFNPSVEGSYSFKVNCQDRYCINEYSEELTVTVYKSLEQPSLTASPSGFCTYQMTSITADKCVGIMEWSTPFQGSFHEKGKNSRREGAFFPGKTSEENFTYKVRCNLNGCLSPEKDVQLSVYPEPPAPVLFSNAPGNTIDRNSRVTIDGMCSNGNIIWDDLFTPTVTLASSVTYHAYCKNYSTGCQTQGRTDITINVLYFPPGAPLASISGVGTNYVTVSWADNADNEDGYRVYRASSGAFADAVEVARLGAGATSYSDGGLSEGNTFYYRIVAYNRYDEGRSNIVSATTSVTPPTVQPPDVTPPTVSPPDPSPCTVSQPSVVAGTATITQGQSVTVSASCASGEIVWTAPAGFTGGNVQPTSMTTYTAKCRVSGDCESREQSVVISVNSIGCTAPAAPTVGNGITVCRGNIATLSAGGCEGGTVTWSSGSSLVAPDVTTSYTAVCSLNGCTSEPSASLSVTVVVVAAPSVFPDHASVRSGETVTLSASCPGGQTVVWTAPDNFTGGSHSPSVTTEYKAKCQDGNGCESGESRTTVSICALPSAPGITVNDITIPSAGGTLIATGCNGGTVTWSGGQTGPSLPVTQAGTYTATCTVTNDCGTATGSDDGRVTVFDTPGTEGPKPKLEQKPWIYHTAWDVCKEATVTLEARNFPAGASFHWSNGATTEKITVGGGSYTLYIEKDGAVSDVSESVSIKSWTDLPVPTNVYADNTKLLPNTTTKLHASGVGSMNWIKDGQFFGSGTEISTSTAGNYKVRAVLGECNSLYSETVAISIAPASEDCSIPSPIISADNSALCAGESTTLTAIGTCEGTIEWSNGATGSIISVYPAATTEYTALCKIGTCESILSNKLKITVTSISAPTVTASPSMTICNGGRIMLTAAGCTGLVTWSNTMTGASIVVSPTSTTTYTATCTIGKCISAPSAPVTITVGNPTAPIISAESTLLCAGESTTLTAVGTCEGSIVWPNGATGSTISVSPAATTEYAAVCKMGSCESVKSNKVKITVKTSGCQ